MTVHEAKIEVLQVLGYGLMVAINGDKANLTSKLHSKGLISDGARDSGDAGKMVADIQYRLRGDEAVWNKLLDILGKMKLREDLSAALSEKTRTNQERSPIGGRTARKFKTRQKF